MFGQTRGLFFGQTRGSAPTRGWYYTPRGMVLWWWCIALRVLWQCFTGYKPTALQGTNPPLCKGKEHRSTGHKRTALRTIHSLYARPTQKNIKKCADLSKNFVFLCHDFQQKLLTHLLLLINFRKLMKLKKLKKLKDIGPAAWNSSQEFFRKKEYCPFARPFGTLSKHSGERTSQTVEDRRSALPLS